MTAFATLMDEVMADADRFGHRQHVQLSWLAVRRHGTAGATALVSDGIRAAAGDSGKFHATMTRAWVEAVGHHAAEDTVDDFDAFVEINPALLDSRLLERFYEPATLRSPAARAGWVEPDRRPFPWTSPE